MARPIADKTKRIFPYQLASNFTRGKYLYEKFAGSNPSILRTLSGLTALPTAAQGEVDRMHTVSGNYIEYFQTTAQTLQPIAHATKGLVIDGDQLDNDTQEYVPGGNSTTSPYAFVMGTDSDFFIKATFEITDASGSDQMLLGFRKVQAYQVPTSLLSAGNALYTDFCGIGFAATKANPNPVAVASDVAGAGATKSTAVNFTWADTLVHSLEVRVIAKHPIYLINGVRLGDTVSKDALGAAITAQATLTSPTFINNANTVSVLTSGDVFVPFIFVRQDADLLDAVYLRDLEIGHLTDVGKDPNNE